MQRQILFGKDSRTGIKAGVDKVANAVKVTLGPKGRNVIISRSAPSTEGMRYYQPLITKDGVTVSRNIVLADYIENTGAMVIKEAAEKTMLMAGDGTTTTCVLVQAIFNHGLELVDAGANPQEVKRGIDDAVAEVVAGLKKIAIPVSGDVEKIRQIATVSANNDVFVGNLIAEAFEKIGSDGIITIEESKSTETSIKVINGYQFDRGWISPYFITNHARSECEFVSPYILLYDKKLYLMKPLENIINLIMSEGKPLLIICDDAEGEALAAIAMNTVNTASSFKACIVRSPGFADAKREEMEDLATITGAMYISDEKGTSLEKANLKSLGKAEKVIVGREETIIIGGKGNKEDVENLLNDLKMNMVGADEAEKTRIEKRIAKLTGGVAVLYVGAPTETEMRERKDRCDDAIRATKAAVAEGYVAGGGNVFARMGNLIDATDDYGKGWNILATVLLEPLKQICANAGVNSTEVMNKADISHKTVGKFLIGYNAKTEVVENLIESGIIDPVKVLRCCIEHAASAATMLLTAECLIVDIL